MIRQTRLGGEQRSVTGIEVCHMAGVALGYESHDELPSWRPATRREETAQIVLRSTEWAILRAVDEAPDVPPAAPPDAGLREQYHLDRGVVVEQTSLEAARWSA